MKKILLAAVIACGTFGAAFAGYYGPRPEPPPHHHRKPEPGHHREYKPAKPAPKHHAPAPKHAPAKPAPKHHHR